MSEDNSEVEVKMGGSVLSLNTGGKEESNLVPKDEGVGAKIVHAGKTYSTGGVEGDHTKEFESLNTQIDYPSLLQETGSVLATLRDTGGGHNIEGKLPHQLIVDTKDGTMSLKVAEGLKHVMKDSQGKYIDAPAQADTSSNSDDSNAPDQAGHLSDEAEEKLSTLSASVGESTTNNILTQVASKTLMDSDGNLTLDDLKLGSDVSDADREAVVSTLQQAVPLLQQQATDFLLNECGVSEDQYADLVDFFWNSNDALGERMEAIQRHFSSGDLSGYRKVVEKFRTHGAYHNKQKGNK